MNPRPVRIAISLALVVLGAACTQAPQLGTLALTITTPSGVVPSVGVTGPGPTYEVTASGELTDLTPGTYAIAPDVVEVYPSYASIERFGAASSSVEVIAGQTTDAMVAYGYVGFRIDDAAGDAAGAVGPDPVFDAIEFSSEVVYEDVVVSIVLREDQTDLSALIGIIDIDVDRDATTGQAPAINAFCDPVPLGTDAVVGFEAGPLNAVLETPGGDVPIDITVAANVVEITIPLADLGSTDGRVHAGAAVGNEAEPTDCVPGGSGSP